MAKSEPIRRSLRFLRSNSGKVAHWCQEKVVHFSTGFTISTSNKCIHSLRYFSRSISISSSSTGSGTTTADLAKFDFFKQEHTELRSTLKKIINKDINPFVDEWEAEGQFPAHSVFKKLGEAGLLGITRPQEYGGLGLDYTYTVAFLEELGTIKCGGIPMAISVHTDMAMPALANFGSEDLKKEFLMPSIAGDRVSCLGVSEIEGGSDVASIRTKAVRDGDDLIINGGKMWITNGCQADWMCLLANTREGPSHKNKSLICLPMKTPGVHVSKKIEKIGMHSSDTAQIFFEDVRVPARNIIGEEGMGFTYQMLQFQEERLAGSIIALAPLEQAITETLEYCKQRKAFGYPIIYNQVIHFRLAELQTEVEALRSLVYRAVGKHLTGENVTLLASMAKLKAGRLAREVTDTCMQYWGGLGYTKDVLISRLFRDMRLLSIGGGTDEIMLYIICKHMGTLPSQAHTKQAQN